MTALCLSCGARWDKPDSSTLAYHKPGCKAWAHECWVAEMDRHLGELARPVDGDFANRPGGG